MENESLINPPVRIEATLEQLITGDYGFNMPNRLMAARGLPIVLQYKVIFNGEPCITEMRVSSDFIAQAPEFKRLLGLDVLRSMSRHLAK